MLIRPAKQRRTCTFGELLNWVVADDVLLSDDQVDSIPPSDYERAKADIMAALRDGQIQPLGYRRETVTRPPQIRDVFAEADSADQQRARLGFSVEATRVPSAFWAYAEIDWNSNRIHDRFQEYSNVQFLMDEVRMVWPLDGSYLQPSAKISASIPASDRIVRRDDNSAAFDDAVKALDEASSAFEQAKDIGDLTAGERTVILSELTAWKGLLNEAQVRVSTFLATLKPTLELVMSKVGDALAKERAKRAIDAFLKWLGLGS
jgi:hypothetical protein